MTLFLQLVVDGLAAGAIYAALALALVLIFRSTHIVNFGQGEMATFSAFCILQLIAWGLPFWLAVAVALIGSFVAGALTFRLLVRPLRGAPVEALVVVTLGLLVLFQALSLFIWGADQRAFPSAFPGGSVVVAGVSIRWSALGALAVLLLTAGVTAAIFRYTRLGLSMRAAAYDSEKSLLVGVDVERMLMLGWGLAAVIGTIAAVLVAPRLFLSPEMMTAILFYSLAAATLGGWDSPLGAVVGGLLVGVFESLGAAYVSWIGADLRIAVPILLTLFVLLVKPVGLFGSRKALKL